MTTRGGDFSHYDQDRGPMDPASMAPHLGFANHKGAEGTTYTDPAAARVLTGLRDHGVGVLGLYMVPRTPGNGGNGSVAAQVDYFLRMIHQQLAWLETWPDRFVVVDSEHWSYDAVPISVGDQCCQLLTQAGWPTLHYAPQWAYTNTVPGPFPLVASNYGGNPAVTLEAGYPGDLSARWAAYGNPPRSPAILQYGSRLTIGSQPGCDGDAYRGTVDQLKAFLRSLITSTPPPTGGTTMTITPTDQAGQIALTASLIADGLRPGNVAQTQAGGVPVPYLPRRFYDLEQRMLAIQGQITSGGFDPDALAQAITNKLIASEANGLTPADHTAIMADVVAALNTLHAGA
jgi:hypothetical protein